MPRKGKNKQREPSPEVQSDGGSEEEDELFTVEVITKARVGLLGDTHDASWEYLVKWAGYPEEDSTWEPEENLQGCERLLKSFWGHIGLDDEDYPVGYTVSATKTWINKEKALFAKTLGAGEEKEMRRKERAREEARRAKAGSKEKERKGAEGGAASKKKDSPKKPGRKAAKTETASPLPEPPKKSQEKEKGKDKGKAKAKQAESDPEDTPRRKKAKDDVKGKGKVKAVLPESDESDSDSEDDVPLAAPPPRKVSTAVKRRIASPDNETPEVVEKTAPAPAAAVQEGPQTKRPRISIDTNVTSVPAAATSASQPTPARKPRSPSSDRDSLFSEEETPAKAPPKKPAAPVPAHRAPPKVKLIDLPSQGGSALATKQRILHSGAAASPTGPPPPLPIPAQRRGSANLAKLTFKKTAGANANANARGGSATPTPADSPVVPGPGWAASPPQGGLADFVQSPVSMEQAFPSVAPLQTESFFTPPVPGPSRVPAGPPPASAPEVDSFLAQIMPPALAAPMDEDRPMPSPIAPPPIPMKPAAFGRIPKKWKWSGELLVEKELDKAERFCEVALTDATDHLPDGLRLSICFSSVESLRLRRLLDVADIDGLLSACARPQQMAKLGPQSEADTPPFQTLVRYMRKKRKMSYAPIVVNNIELGILLVYPSAESKLANMFKVPDDLRDNVFMTAVLIPWRLNSTRYAKYKWQSRGSLPVDSPKVAVEGRIPGAVLQAISLLHFPQWLFDHMRMPNRPYCVWNTSDGTPAAPGVETAALRTILRHYNAPDAGHKADVRVVFVHVGSLRTLHKLPALVERRCKRPEIQFVTYGTHESAPIKRWGVREIFPLGGIVTFTPSSIVDTPLAAFKLISQIAEHPLWQCYVTPAVLAAVVREVYKDQRSPNQALRGDDPLYSQILTFVEEGQLSLIQAPPLNRSLTQGKDPINDWISLQTVLMRLNSQELGEECMKIFRSEYANVPEAELAPALLHNISKGLAWMQAQPACMDEFRRFVVITGPQDKHINWDRDGFEWLPVTRFDFKDDFFRDSK